MKLFSYQSAKGNKKAFKSMTSLAVEEFDELCIVFGECWNEHTKEHEKDPTKGGRPLALITVEDRLFFILYYLKAYPLQEILAYSFEVSQSEANKLVHLLSFVLKMTLQKAGFTPPRLSDDMLAKLEQEALQDYSIDGTERPIVRPSNQEVQEYFYSGKKRRHTIKNNVVVGINDRQIKGLSGTHEGKKHDKKICDEEHMRLPKGSNGVLDTGFQGCEMEDVNIRMPKKNHVEENSPQRTRKKID